LVWWSEMTRHPLFARYKIYLFVPLQFSNKLSFFTNKQIFSKRIFHISLQVRYNTDS
jgi:hypothetical protein